MADEPEKSRSWWSTLPGILTATAAVITAVTGLVAILSQSGVFGEKSKAFVNQKASDVRDAVTPPVTSGAKTVVAEPGPTVVASVVKDGAASGIAGTPLRSMPFTGAIVTQSDGVIVKLRDDVKEYCQGAPLLKATNGQQIEMRRIARFDVVDWRKLSSSASAGTGTVHVTLNNGETLDVVVEECAMTGSNDLGVYKRDFETIRSVEFVR